MLHTGSLTRLTVRDDREHGPVRQSPGKEDPTLIQADYIRPSRLDAALEAVTCGTLVAAGCTDLFASTSRPELPGGRVLDITAIDDLRGIRRAQGSWRIGPTTSWSAIRSAEYLPPAFDALRQAGREVGAIQIQNSGTVGGNICNASPAADGVPPLLLLDAEVELRTRTRERRMPLTDFILGPRRTALEPDELLVGIVIPEAAARGRSVFVKLGARTHLVISIAMVAARLEVNDRIITRAALSVGSCSAVAARLPAAEDELVGRPARPGTAEGISEQAIAGDLSPISDIRSDAGYRRAAAAIMIRRAVRTLLDGPDA